MKVGLLDSLWVFTFLLFLLTTLAGCKTACHNTLPKIIVGSDGLTYELLAPYSIQQHIDDGDDEARHKSLFIHGLIETFPSDQNLINYLKAVDQRDNVINNSRTNRLYQVQKELFASGGDLYTYKSWPTGVFKRDRPDEEYTNFGFVIIKNGKIFHKY
jgi:hypothetical protein